MASTPLSPIRTWIAERVLGVPGGTFGPAAQKSNPVGSLVASMFATGSPVYTPISFEALAREGFQRNGYVFRAITIIAQACAGVPWVLYRDKGPSTTRRLRGGSVNTTEVDSHPLLDLLARPHATDDIIGTASLIEQFVSYYVLAGNAYLYAGRPTTRPNAPPQELWVLRPDRVRIIPAADGSAATYRYTVGGRHTDFAPADILHWKTFHPSDDYYGLSPVAVAARTVDQMNSANDWNTALLQNLARPGGFVSTPANLDDNQFERLVKELKDQYAGAKNAGRPHLLEGGLTWQQVGLSPLDMDWLAGKIANVREIAVALGVPSQLMGDSTNSTYANYQEARKAFYMETALPRLDLLRDLLNAWLVPMFGDAGLRLDYDRDDIEALQEDRALVWGRAQQAWDSGLLTQNEARDLIGYEATPDGDVFLTPAHDMTLAQLLAGMNLPSAQPPALPPAPPTVEAGKARHVGRQRKARADQNGQRDKWVETVRSETRAQFQAEADRLAAILKDAAKHGTAPETALRKVLDEVHAGADEWAALFSTAFSTVSEQAGASLMRQFAADGLLPKGTAYDATRAGSQVASALAKGLPAEAAKITVETTGKQLQASLSGQPIEDMLDSLKSQYEEYQGGRAELISDAQVLPGWSIGQLDAAFQAADVTGSRVTRTWVTVGDAQVRPEHAAADGQTVGLHEAFDVGGEQLMYPGDFSGGSPGNTYNCRCSLDYALELETGA